MSEAAKSLSKFMRSEANLARGKRNVLKELFNNISLQNLHSFKVIINKIAISSAIYSDGCGVQFQLMLLSF